MLGFILDKATLASPISQSLIALNAIAYSHIDRFAQNHTHQLWNHSSSVMLPGLFLTQSCGVQHCSHAFAKAAQCEARKDFGKLWGIGKLWGNNVLLLIPELYFFLLLIRLQVLRCCWTSMQLLSEN